MPLASGVDGRKTQASTCKTVQDGSHARIPTAHGLVQIRYIPASSHNFFTTGVYDFNGTRADKHGFVNSTITMAGLRLPRKMTAKQAGEQIGASFRAAGLHDLQPTAIHVTNRLLDQTN